MKLLPASLLLLLASCAPVDEGDLDSSFDASGFDIEYAAPIPSDAEFHPTRILVGGANLPGAIELEGRRFAGQKAQRVLQFEAIGAAAFELPAGADVVEEVEALRQSGRFGWVEPDYVREALVNDPYRSFQWNLDAIDAEGAWSYSTGSGVVVAVIDTGVSAGTLDGLGSVVSGYDFVNSDSDPRDDNGHGTHVAGTIAQATDNASGVAGLAYGASIMPVKVLNSAGSGYTSTIVSGINYAVSNGAQVINLSLGSSTYSSTEATAVANAYSAGVFVAAASGNSGSTSVAYPGAYSGAVAVGATRVGNTRPSYSNRGTALDLVAPGGDTSRDDNGDGYADGILQETFSGSTWSYYFFQGTSMASPHVAAAAALLMARGATAAEAESYLKSTATDLGTSGFDTSYGYGLIQPGAALAAFLDAGGGGGGADGGATDGGASDGGASDGGATDGGATDGGAGDGGAVEACVVSITRTSYSRGRFEVRATVDEPGASLSLSIDGVSAGSMTYKSSGDYYQRKGTISWRPSTASVSSDCGGSATSSF